MGFLGGLGLGFLGYGSTPYNPFQNQQAMAGNYPLYAQTHFVCKHYNCSICREEGKKQAVEQEEIKLKIAENKKDYELRCKEYMERFKRR